MPTAHGDGMYKGEEDKPATFYVDASGLKGDLFVQVDGEMGFFLFSIATFSNRLYKFLLSMITIKG